MEQDSSHFMIYDSIKLVFPKPLKGVQIVSPLDENGFSSIEKAALRNAWRFLLPFKRSIGRMVYHNFLMEYETQIEKFRFDNKININRLHYHTQISMDILGHLILKCLDHPLEFRSTLEDCMPRHTKYNVSGEHILILAMSMKDFLVTSDVLEKNSSETLEIAFEKLLSIIGKYNRVEEQRKETASRKYSMMQQHAMGSVDDFSETLSQDSY